MTRLEVEIDQTLLDAISEAFPDATDAAEEVTTLALTEWCEWLTGNRRPSSIAEQNTQRVVELISRLQPDPDFSAASIAKTFGLPLGQARHIAQEIGYVHTHLIQSTASNEIKQALLAQEAEIKAQGRSNGTVKIRIRRQSENALRRLIHELGLTDSTVPAPKRARDFTTHVDYDIRVRDVRPLLEMIAQ